jgi:trimeric autotransporter adhesin
MLFARFTLSFLLTFVSLSVYAENQSSHDLAQFLNREGQLELPEGFSGTLDVEGFSLVTGTDGSPRFVSASRRGATAGEWSTFGGLPAGCNGRVSAIVAAPDNVLYLGGQFNVCGDVLARHVAGLDLTTGDFFNLSSGPSNGVDGPVKSMALDGANLFVGGEFKEAGGQQANHIARWDGANWHALGTGSDNGVNGFVWALAKQNSDIYAAGMFSQAGGEPAKRIARWDGGQWHPLGEGSAEGVNNTVFALAASATDVYVGGDFTEAGGQVVNHVARWDGTSWSPMSDSIGTGVNDLVEALAVSDGDVFVGGSFTEAGGETANRIARWDGTAWHSLTEGGNNGVNQFVKSLYISGDDLYVGGTFWIAGGESAQRVARWDGIAWHPLEEGQENGLGGPGSASAHAIVAVGNSVYVGGLFGSAGGQYMKHLAHYDGSVWAPLGAGSGYGVSGDVKAVAVDNGNLYVGGFFWDVGGQQANSIARWDGTQWHALGSGDFNGVTGTTFRWYGSVESIAIGDDGVYVGGNFEFAGDEVASHVARWDGANWHALEEDGQNGTNLQINALLIKGGDLFVGGYFTSAAGTTANRIARWDGISWHSLGEGTANGLGSTVSALTEFNDDLIVGGSFLEAGGAVANRIARWDGTSWHPLGQGTQNGLSGPVDALVSGGDNLYVGGRFAQAGEQLSRLIARWDGSGWHALGGGITPPSPFPGSVDALMFFNGSLYVAGFFTEVEGQIVNNVARWDGVAWHSLGDGMASGVDSQTRALATDGADIIVGGGFGLAGGNVSVGIARFNPPPPPAVGLSVNQADLGTFPVGESSDPLVLTIENSGEGVLALGSISIEATMGANSVITMIGGSDFNILADNCSNSSLEAGENCTIEIEFSPSEPGLRQAFLRIESNSPTSPDFVELIGNNTIFADRLEMK